MSLFFYIAQRKTTRKKASKLNNDFTIAAATLLTNMLQKSYGGSRISVIAGQLHFNLSCWVAESWTIACTLAQAGISFLSLLMLETDTVPFGKIGQQNDLSFSKAATN